MGIKKNFGGIDVAIKKGRERKGWSQKALANYLDVSVTTISQWENGKKIPSGDLLIELIEKLELVSDLFPDYCNTNVSKNYVNSFVLQMIEKFDDRLKEIERELELTKQ